jgi:uncharacterized protein YdaU (DUF1376 family)
MSETRKNLPNIPLYIGDWEKDCNVLSLEAEAAWLRIIFKMFTNGKQSSYKIPTKGLQNLWRVSEEKAQEIIEELTDFNICEIRLEGRFIEFTSRRYKKENAISQVRKEAVSKRKDRSNNLQTEYKLPTNKIQNTEIENEIENENENDQILEKSEKPFFEKSNEIDFQELEIFKKCSEYFSQTTEAAKMKMFGDFRRIHQSGKFEEFEKQTLSYFEYKELSKESIHRWQNYAYEWNSENWIDLLKKLKAKSGKPQQITIKKTQKDFLDAGSFGK